MVQQWLFRESGAASGFLCFGQAAFFGLGAYLGKPMTQSYLGDILGHVMDVSDYEPKSRGYRKGGGQLMHTDSCDIIGLMCLKSAISGGESRISSALAVHNVMAEQYPEQLKLLADGLFLKRTDEDGRIQLRDQVKKLTLPTEMGERFQAIGLQRGVDFEPAFELGDLSWRL